MRRLFSTSKASLSFGVTKLVLFSLESKLSSAKFWRSQIGLVFIFFSLLPSLTEAHSMHCEPLVEEGSTTSNFDQIVKAAGRTEETVLNFTRPVFEQTVLILIGKFLSSSGSEQEAYADQIKAFGVEALPLLEFAKDKWPKARLTIDSLENQVRTDQAPSLVRVEIIDEIDFNQATGEPKSCLYDAEMRSQIVKSVEELKDSLRDSRSLHRGGLRHPKHRDRRATLNRQQVRLRESIRGFIQDFDHSTCFVGNASLSHVCPLLQAGGAADLSIGASPSDRNTEYFWIEAKDADGKLLHLRQRLRDGEGSQFWEIFDSKGQNKKRLGYMMDYEADGIIDKVWLSGRRRWQTRSVGASWENGQVVEGSDVTLKESYADYEGLSVIDTRQKYQVDFETQRASGADICESGQLSNPSVLLSNLTFDINWKLSEVAPSDDGFWRGFDEGLERARFVFKNAARDFLIEGAVFLLKLFTDSGFRDQFLDALAEAAKRFAEDTVLDIAKCKRELPSRLGFEPPDFITSQLCGMGVGLDVLEKLFWQAADKAMECVNINGDPDKIAKCWAEVAAFAAGSAVTGGATGAIRAGASGVTSVAGRTALRVGVEIVETAFDPGAGSFVAPRPSAAVVAGAPLPPPAASGNSARAGGRSVAEPRAPPERPPPSDSPSDFSSNRVETARQSKESLIKLLSEAIEKRKAEIEDHLIGAAKTTIKKGNNIQSSINALADLRTSKAIEALAEIANDPDPTKAKAAIDALASTNTKEAIDALEAIANGSDAAKAQAAIDALASTNTTEAKAVLLKIIRSNSPQAEAAVEALDRMSAPLGSAGATSGAAKAAEPASPATALTAEEIIEWANTFRLNDSTTTGLPWLNGARGLLELPDQVEKFLGEGGIADNLLSEGRWLDHKSLQANLKHLENQKNRINNPRGLVDLLVELDVPKPAKELFEGEGGSVKAYWFADVGASKGEGSPPAVFDQAAKVSENGSETTHLIDVKRTQGDSLPPNQIASIKRKIDAAKSQPSLHSHDGVEPNPANFKFTVWIVREGGRTNFEQPDFGDYSVDVIFQDSLTGEVTRGDWSLGEVK